MMQLSYDVARFVVDYLSPSLILKAIGKRDVENMEINELESDVKIL